MDNSINFGAKRLQTTSVLEYNHDTRTYAPCEVSFAEIKPKCASDREAIRRLTNEWYGAKFLQPIYEDILELTSEKPRIKSRVFVLTTQQKNLKELEHRKILGIAEMNTEDKKFPLLNYLQVDPDIVYALLKPNFKYVGTGILNSLKKMYSSITVNSACGEVPKFYEANGFKVIEPVLLRYRWLKK